MKTNIKINNPCPEKWEHMQSSSQGKFCQICSKNIFDFTDRTDEEIKDVLNKANDGSVCGRLGSPFFPKIAAGVILMTNIAFVQAQTKDDSGIHIEKRIRHITKMSGRLIHKETGKVISGAEVFFITKKQYIKSSTNENGFFSIDLPDDLIKAENVLYFNFDEVNELKRKEHKTQGDIGGYNYGNQAVFFSKQEKMENRKFEINDGGYEIGTVVFVEDPPPNHYYLDGKSIGEEKFEKLKKEYPDYLYFSFEGRAAKIIDGGDFIDTLQLLYSK
ncbi:hypothetical protein [Chryseobacterium sp.]|uniref:hypothetical protein n=1 Tax=Chryseobacterium sp. TaxID=1871047 RepID=UPI0025BEC8F0|nr:hypothetical protein [Chryseobacterium sp.]MBV8326588.1 hypothetical protein [Chryseobacterium sp.]